MNFSKVLTKWYLKNKRDLPWRETNNPYFIWLSEIILQQTRVAQGMPYFLSFINSFPTVFDLADASEEQVLKLWQGLGYYSRARNLHKTAQYVAFELGGKFPENYKELLKLKGVGEYTAAAIASFSYNEAVPVVDGNVYRVLSRYFDIQTDISLAAAKKEFSAIAIELMPRNEPAMFNQSIMEFGALQCVPQNPNCGICIFNASCVAFEKKKVAQLPIKSKKQKITNRFFNYIVFEDEQQNTFIVKRVSKGIWHNLYEFPLVETQQKEGFGFISAKIHQKEILGHDIISVFEMNPDGQIHKLSHQHLHIKFWKVNVRGSINGGIDYPTLLTFPFPIVIFNFIEKLLD